MIFFGAYQYFVHSQLKKKQSGWKQMLANT